jgi:hypothetical protein
MFRPYDYQSPAQTASIAVFGQSAISGIVEICS